MCNESLLNSMDLTQAKKTKVMQHTTQHNSIWDELLSSFVNAHWTFLIKFHSNSNPLPPSHKILLVSEFFFYPSVNRVKQRSLLLFLAEFLELVLFLRSTLY